MAICDIVDLIMKLVHKYGTTFTAPHRVSGEYGHLDGHIRSVVHHLGTCHPPLTCPSAVPPDSKNGSCISSHPI